MSYYCGYLDNTSGCVSTKGIKVVVLMFIINFVHIFLGYFFRNTRFITWYSMCGVLFIFRIIIHRANKDEFEFFFFLIWSQTNIGRIAKSMRSSIFFKFIEIPILYFAEWLLNAHIHGLLRKYKTPKPLDYTSNQRQKSNSFSSLY